MPSNRRIELAAILGCAVVVAACGPRAEVPAACLAVPEAVDVEIVKVTPIAADGNSGASYQIDTRPRVEALIEALAAQSGAECRTVETRRTQTLSVALEGRDSVPLILWIGADWIGGVDTHKDARGVLTARWRPLVPGEHGLLIELLRQEGAPSGSAAPVPGAR